MGVYSVFIAVFNGLVVYFELEKSFSSEFQRVVKSQLFRYKVRNQDWVLILLHVTVLFCEMYHNFSYYLNAIYKVSTSVAILLVLY